MSGGVTLQAVGRDREWNILTDAITALERGTGSCVVLTGVAGIGKTLLLDSAVSLAGERRLLVARGRATELDRVAPLSTVVTTLRSVLGPDRLPPIGANQYSRIDLVTERLEEVTRERPLVVVIDDAQWTDELSAFALRVLIPRLSLLPILWLLARSPVPAELPAQGALRWLIGDGVREVHLRPLTEDAIAALCRRVLGARVDATVSAIAARSGGNPFLLQEVLTNLSATERINTCNGLASVVGSELPSGFLSAVEQRLSSLSPEVRQLLQIGAVLGGTFSLHTAALLLHRPTSEVMTIADEAVASGTLVDCDSRLAFQHDLVREAVYDNMNGAVRSMLHREATLVLRAEGRPVVEIADHLVRAEYRGDVQTVELLRAAAGQMAACAPSTSANLLLRAVEMLEDADRSRPMLISDAVRMLASAGRLAEARTWGERALRGPVNSEAEGQLVLGLAESYKHAGHNGAVVELTDRGLALPSADGAIRAQLYAVRAHALLATDLPAADQAAERAVDLGTRVGVSAAVAFGSAARSVVARARGDLDDALRFAKDAVAEIGRAGGVAEHHHPDIWMGAALVAQGRFEEAEEIYATGQREAERLGTAWSLPLWHFYRASLYFAQGRLSDVEAEGEAGLRVAEHVGALQLGVPLAALLGRVAALRDQMPLARDYLHRTQRMLATGITVPPEDAGWAAAVIHEAGGQLKEAYQALTELNLQLPERVLMFVQDPGALAAMVRIHKQAGRPAEEARIAALAAGLARRNPGNSTLAGAAAHADGLARMDVARLNESVALLESSRRPLVWASAVEDTAVAELAAGRKARAVKLFKAALAVYDESGARQGLLRVEQRMQAVGVRQQARSAPVESPLAGLTQAELRVVELVVNGATNREVARQLFLSPHTVDSHLRKVFAKLGISSRVELTRIVMANADIT
jgi:DNA-binding CsgD family transcriptional regulator/tetratricopeptide (TPR) repeat protein